MNRTYKSIYLNLKKNPVVIGFCCSACGASTYPSLSDSTVYSTAILSCYTCGHGLMEIPITIEIEDVKVGGESLESDSSETR